MIKKNLIFILLAIIAGVVLAFMLFAPKPAGATFVQKYYVCHVEKPDEGGVNQQTLYLPLSGYLSHILQHKADYAGQCKEIEVTPTPTIEPNCEELKNCEATPTPEQPKGNPSDERFAGSSTEAPAPKICTGIYPDQPIGRPDLYKKTGSTSAHFEFFGGQADHYEVEYKLSENGFVYGIPGGLPGTSTAFDINDLPVGFNVLLARVHAFRGGCELVSEWFN